jgi:hypothetical protein
VHVTLVDATFAHAELATLAGPESSARDLDVIGQARRDFSVPNW